MAEEQKQMPLNEKFCGIILLQIVWDNIDYRLTGNNLHKRRVWSHNHGIIVVSVQTLGSAPIISESFHSVLTLSEYNNPRDMLQHGHLCDNGTSCSMEAIICRLL